MIEITKISEAEFENIWPIFQKIVKEGGTYVYRPDISKEEAKTVWFANDFQTYIAKAGEDIVGAYVIRPGHRDLGSHIANAAYIVSKEHRGKGYGRLMGEHSFDQARSNGYKAMQFNYVVSSNAPAIALWESLGFEIVGTVPEAYQTQSGSYTDIHIMYKKL